MSGNENISTDVKITDENTGVSIILGKSDFNIAADNIPVLTNAVKESDFDQFPEEMKIKALEISKSVTLSDSNSIATFAAFPQKAMSKHLDAMLSNVRSNQVGQAGALVAELATGLKGLNFEAMKSEANRTMIGRARTMVSKVPVVGRWASQLERMKSMSDGIQSHMDNIEARAQSYMGQLKKGSQNMDQLLSATEQNLYDLSIWLRGGELALRRMREEFEVKKNEVIQSQDPIKLTLLRDVAEQINAFETRLVRLHIAFTQGIQSVPQIRMSQQAAKIELQNTLDTVLMDIPAIKSAIIRIMTLDQITSASHASKARRRLSRDLGRISQDMLENAYTRAKESQGDFSKDVAFLAEIAGRQSLLGAKAAAMDKEAHMKREAAKAQIEDIRSKFIEDQREFIMISTSVE